MNRVLSTLAALAVAAPFLPAQSSVGPDPAASYDLRGALADWRSQHGSSWRAVESARTGRVEFLHGGSAAAALHPESAADFERLARTAIADTAGLHGIDPETLAFERTLHIPLAHLGTTDKTTVSFRQVVDGVPVFGGTLNVLFDMEGRLLSVQSTALPELGAIDTRPGLHSLRASGRAAEAFEGETGLEPNHLHAPELWIDLIDEGEEHRAHLVWRVGVEWRQDGVEPMGYTYTVDAFDGRVLRRDDRIHHFDVTGTVSTWASPGSSADSGSNPEALLPLGRATLTSNQGSTVSDANGNFTFSGINTANNVQVQYLGSFVNVNNSAGADHSVNAGTLTGSGNSIVLNPAQANLITAQANAHRAVSFFRDWVRSINPSDGTMDFVATANVNLSATCNAFYDGVSTNYFQAGGSCRNTAFSAIVAHEQGHWANSRYNTNNGNDGMGEGNADVFAMYQYDTPLVGEGFFTSGGAVRTGNNLRQYCGDGNGGCYGQVHNDGEVWMGAAWKVRSNLKNSLGSVLGGDTADSLFMGWMNSYNQTTINSVIETQWLTLDDDNGNINDGTPNYEPINQGFLTQGFPGFELFYIDLLNVTRLPDTSDVVGPYSVSADVIPLINPLITSVTIYSRVQGTPSFVSTPMTFQGGNTWSGQIPGPQSGAIFTYYVEASDSGGQTERTRNAHFGVGNVVTALADNFEADLGWTVTNSASLTDGAWERADPVGTTQSGNQAQPANDFSDVGTLCYVTNGAGGGAGANDVDGGPTRLFTPVFDLQGQDAIISFAVWFYNDDGDDNLLIAMSNNGGNSWTNVRDFSESTDGWLEDSFVVTNFVTPTSNMKIRIRAEDDPNNSVTEALIDDVHIRYVDGTICPDPVSYCPAVANSTGQAAGLSWSGSPFISANNLVFTTTGMPTFTNGVMIYSPDQVSTPLGDGILCVGNSTLGFVLRLPAFTTDFLGFTTFAFDNTAPPDPAGQVSAGETWYFQTWFRDPAAGGAGFNFSDALCVTFCP